MGLFDKILGGNKKGNDFKPSADLMQEEHFWTIIKSTYDNANGDFEAQQEEMTKTLSKLSPQDIIHFDNRFRDLRGQAYDWQLWAAIYIIHGGCGDDSFTDFRDWVISQGKDFYYKTLANPETLVELDTEKIEVEWEGMGYIASTVFEELTGQEIASEFRENQNIKGTEWSDENNDELKKMFPTLWAKYAENYID
jgi:Protein of unknown function (DUF4240)